MMSHLKTLEAKASAWSNVSIRPHPFGGREFRFGDAEVGHVNPGGIVDIPFPRSVRDALLAEGLAEEHPWVPELRMDHISDTRRGRRQPCSLAHATVISPPHSEDRTDPQKLFEHESEQLQLVFS